MNICLYGASSDEIDKSFIQETEKLGRIMAERGHTLVFGGGTTGLMGAAARGISALGGKLIGIAPKFFDVEGVLFKSCSELIFTETMRERKQKMEDMSEAFVMTPGGIGTFDEFFEILTLRQLNKHSKPIAIFNIGGYFDPLLDMLNRGFEAKFITKETIGLVASFTDAEQLVLYLEGEVV